MAAKRDTLAAIRARRAAENDRLRAELARIEQNAQALAARKQEILSLLGESPAEGNAGGLPGPSLHQGRQRCRDCGAVVDAPEPIGDRRPECPVCEAAPFEGEPLQ